MGLSGDQGVFFLPRSSNSVPSPSARRLGLLVFVCSTLVAGGCVPPTTSPEPPSNSKDVEPNNDLTLAKRIEVGVSGESRFAGRIQPSTDVDVYALGPMEPGDRIVARVSAADGSSLDAHAALFNDEVEIINLNDDEDYEADILDSLIEHDMRHASANVYLAVTSSPAAPSRGTYTVEVTITRDGEAPQPQAQNVLLDFRGGSVFIPSFGRETVDAFAAAEIDDRLAGRDAEAKEQIRTDLEDRYRGYGIEFYATDDPVLPNEGDYTRLLFGGERSGLFGIAEQIDPYNADPTDEAVIYTEDWASILLMPPSTDEILTGIANVAAHELGHLLGLQHTVDITGLMDSSGGASTVLVPQAFKRSPVNDDVFSFGWQDAPQLLSETLGLLE